MLPNIKMCNTVSAKRNIFIFIANNHNHNQETNPVIRKYPSPPLGLFRVTGL